MRNIKDILKDFSKYAEARKSFTLRTKNCIYLLFCYNSNGIILQLPGR